MTPQMLTLRETELDAVFPAYLRLDAAGRIVSAGPSLRVCGAAPEGAPFFETFRVERPVGVADLATLARFDRPLVIRLIARPRIRLRGMALVRDDGLWLLTGHIPELERIDEGPALTSADFSPADGTFDMLLAAEMRAGLLAEAHALCEALDGQRRAAERANTAKSAFLAMMSHEIRTPMTAVLGLADILADTGLSAAQRDMLEVMAASGRLLMDTLNDVLDISKIESGKMDFEETVFDVEALVRGVGAVFEAAAAAKGLGLDVATEAPQPWRRGDPVRLRQILVNLISNAIKFTDAGEVRVRAGFRAGASGPVFELAVRDSGIGMSREAMGRLFTPFVQGDGSTARRFGGTGLGLAISRLLCDRMGGSIRAESRIGRGSTFTVEIPLPGAAPPLFVGGPGDDDFPEGASPHVLLVEDNSTNQFVISLLLDKSGATFELARNGSEALLAWERGGHDLVLMDIEMPVMDGIEATRELRRREAARGGRRTPIIGLSADAMVESGIRARQAGMDGFATKPIDLERLGRLIRRTCADARATGRPGDAG